MRACIGRHGKKQMSQHLDRESIKGHKRQGTKGKACVGG